MTANLWADASGACGDLYWSFNSSTGKLTVTGTGGMSSWTSASGVPWSSKSNEITSVSLPIGLTSIGQYAFSYCSALTGVTIPNSVAIIRDHSFMRCAGLTSISIPNSVTRICSFSFQECTGITDIYVYSTTPCTLDNAAFWLVDLSNLTLHVPYGASETYAATNNWNQFTDIVEMLPFASLTSAPTSVTGLSYNGTAQELVNAGTAENGTMYYSLDYYTWSTSIPTGTLAGDYTIYYKVVADAGYTDYEPYPNSISVTIAPKYAITTASGTQDAANWEMTPAFADAGQTVTMDYNGDLRVENITLNRIYRNELTANSMSIGSQGVDFNSKYGSKLVITSDLNTSHTFTSIEGVIDLDGHTCSKSFLFQNNIEGSAITVKNGTIHELDGHSSWGDWYRGTVIVENISTDYIWTDGHAYIINGGTHNRVENYNNGAGEYPGTIVIYDGNFKTTFNQVTPDATRQHGTYTLYGGKYAFDPTTLTCTVIIPDGFSLQSNTDSDSGTYPYVVKSNSPSVTPPSLEHDYQLTETVAGHQWTITMPDYQVEMAVSYYPLASIATAPTAADGLVYTGSAQALLDNAGTAENGTMNFSLDNSTWSTEIPTATEAGNYTVYYKVFGDATHSNYAPDDNTIAVAIAKTPLTITADDRTLEYGDPAYWCNHATYTGFVNGEDVTVLSGAVQFDNEYTDGSNVGVYAITPYGVTAANYEITFVPGTVTVNKADAAITSAPVAIDGLEYTGTAHTLITLGTAEGGEMQYKLGDGAYSTALPQATDEGSYLVWYKVVGDQNHNGVAEASVLVSIAAPSVLVLTANSDPQHAGIYYSTFYHSAIAYELSAGVEAYVAELSTDALHLTKIAKGGQVIPADNAVILKANSSDVTLTPSNDTPVSFTAPNSLLGVDVETPVASVVTSGTCYVLSGHSSDNSVTGVGFYTYTDILKAHKAYAVLGANLAPPMRLRFVFSGTTDLEPVTGNPSPVTQKVIENGVLYIIKNGEKYNAQGQVVK